MVLQRMPIVNDGGDCRNIYTIVHAREELSSTMRSRQQSTTITKSMAANKKKSEWHRILAFIAFLAYFVVLFYFLFFSGRVGEDLLRADVPL